MAEDRMLSDEILLGLIKANGGGGGTSDYSQLSNKPQINNVVLTGNKSLSDLGIGSADAVSANANAISAIKDGTNIDSFAEVETALADKADQSEVDDIKSETATLTGNPITLSDALSADAISVVAEIEPVQDLHGYEKPWAGGSGKNKLPLVLADIKSANTDGTWSGNAYTVNDVTFTVNTDSDGNVTGITANGTASARVRLDIKTNLVASDYIGKVLNGCPSGGSGSTYRLLIQEQSSPYIEVGRDYGDGSVISTTNVEYLQCFILVNSGVSLTNVVFYPMIRLASVTDATFEPYTNICPISGMTEVNVTTTDGTDTNTATASLGTTVYGGSVDVTEGSASVEYASVTLTGSETWGKSALTDCDIFVLTLSTWELTSSTLLSHFPFVDIKNYNTLGNAWWDGDRKQLRIGFSEYGTTTIDQFKAWLADNNVQVVAELATPTTLSFTSDDLAMLSGENTISTDAEEVSVEYIKNTLAGRVKHLEDESGVVDYSTTEQKTGQKWIDGKDIYFRVVVLENALSIPPQTWTSSGESGTNLSTIVNAFGIDNNGTYFTLNATPNVGGSGNYGFLQTRSVDLVITKYIIYYTKTT